MLTRFLFVPRSACPEPSRRGGVGFVVSPCCAARTKREPTPACGHPSEEGSWRVLALRFAVRVGRLGALWRAQHLIPYMRPRR